MFYKVFSSLNKRLFNIKTINLTIKNSYSSNVFSERIFSGIQPTGSIHLGNYFGAIQNWVEIHNTNSDVLFSIVDLHSITVPQNPKTLQDNIIKAAATLIACGIDPEKCILFQQSMVPHHCELFWILGCLMPMGRLSHFPQFKEKTASLKEIPLGLYLYPVLQAADILLYKATLVPVGEDQLPHLQMTQYLIKTFNNKYGLSFPKPRILVGDSHAAKIKSLRDPLKKMSKSDPDQKSCIYLTDDSDIILKKCKKAITDFTSELSFDPEKRPGVSNLISIHSLFTGKAIDDIILESKGIETGKYKLLLADIIIEHLKPIQKEYNRLINDPHFLINVLKDGGEKAKNIAYDNILEIKTKVGLNIEQLYFNEQSTIYSN